jgi:hypothetical protein
LAFGISGRTKAALIVGDDDLHILRRQVLRFGDDPHARLWAFRAGDDAADVIGIDAHLCGALCRSRRARRAHNIAAKLALSMPKEAALFILMSLPSFVGFDAEIR